MANTLTPIIDKLIARGLNVLRENAVMPRLVNSTYSSVARDRGDTITVPVAADITAASVYARRSGRHRPDEQDHLARSVEARRFLSDGSADHADRR